MSGVEKQYAVATTHKPTIAEAMQGLVDQVQSRMAEGVMNYCAHQAMIRVAPPRSQG